MNAVAVIGRNGQLARSLAAARPGLTFLARPDLDLAAPATIAPALDTVKPAIIINAAAYTAVDRAEQEPELAEAVNAAGPRALAKWCHSAGACLIHVSTDYVFDGSKSGPYLEDDPVGPLGAYGASKLRGENAVRAILPAHVILRTAWVHSPYGKNFVRTMLRLAGERDRVRVVDDQRGSPTCALDLADAVLCVAKSLASDMPVFGVFHWVNGGSATWADLAEAIFAKASPNLLARAPSVERITTADCPTRARRPANSRLATERFVSTFGKEPPSWREGLARTLCELERATS